MLSKEQIEQFDRDGFLVVSAFWLGLGIAGAVPLMASDSPHMPLTDAVFESISGLTTTGATVLTGLDDLPRSVLFYRQLLQWLGGMGIIVLAVAILPVLGIGGMQLFRAEVPGPVAERLTPRISQTAKLLWGVYVLITGLEVTALMPEAEFFAAPKGPGDAIGIDWDEAERTLSKGMLSYLKESRRMDNRRMLEELGIELQYPTLEVGLVAMAQEND